MLRKFLIELVVVGIIVGWAVAEFLDALTPWIPWLCMAVLWHLTWEIAKGRRVKRTITHIVRGRSVMVLYTLAFLVGGLLSVAYFWSVNAVLSRVARKEQFLTTQKARSPLSTQSPLSPQSIAEQNKIGNPALSHVEGIPAETPIENLARLGWNIKSDDKAGITFEISDKPLPSMKESADSFRAVHKPFRLNLQQVPSIAGLRFLSEVNDCVGVEIGASNIDDLAELRDLTSLRTLVISQTPFTARNVLDISPLSSLLNLETLSLGMSRVTNLESLRGLTKLKSLSIGGSLVRDLSPIKGLTSLKSLDVRDSGVTDVSTLGGDDALEELSVDNKQIPSLTHLSRLPNLTRLNIIARVPVDMAAVGSLSNLKFLFIWGPPVIDMSPLRNLGKLTTLQVSGFGFTAGRSRIIDADAIGDLSQLRTLTLGSVEMNSLMFLTRLNNLVQLNLNDLPVTSVSESADIKSLKQISLVDVPIVDISPFLSLPNLAELSLLRTPARADVVSELERRGVKVIMN